MVTDPENFEQLKSIIIKLGIFECNRYSDSFIQRRIEVRLRSTGLFNYVNYIKLLNQSNDERAKLGNEFTIHVTNFFRDTSMWSLLKEKIIPLIVSSKKNGESIQVWSAGCSSGEEPLSIAISFVEALGANLDKYNLSILATDLDKDTVTKAQAAAYELEQFKEMPPEYIDRYFNKIDSKYVAKPTILKYIKYRVLDVFGEKSKNLDIIFCRNTVIYFSIDAKSKLYLDFYTSLKNNSFFIMGKTEVLQGPARDLFQIYDNHERVYVKE
jgi:chemotaxis methyl-accepting protein methylase